MVYFGKKQFKKPRRGLVAEAITIAVMATLAICVLGLAVQGYLGDAPTHFKVGDEIVEPKPFEPDVEFVPPHEIPPPQAPKPFAEYAPLRDELLGAVPIGGLDPEPSTAELMGVSFLLHRFRAENEGPPEQRIATQPLQPSIVDWQELRAEAPNMLGKRYPLYLRVLRPPRFVEAQLHEGNPSGVRDFYQVWGYDLNRHLHLVQFFKLDDDRKWFAGDAFEVEADFLRMHEYRTQSPQVPLAAVPQWVAYELLEPRPGIEAPPSNSLALALIGLGLVVVAIVLISQWRHRHPPLRLGKKRTDSEKPSSIEG